LVGRGGGAIGGLHGGARRCPRRGLGMSRGRHQNRSISARPALDPRLLAQVDRDRSEEREPCSQEDRAERRRLPLLCLPDHLLHDDGGEGAAGQCQDRARDDLRGLQQGEETQGCSEENGNREARRHEDPSLAADAGVGARPTLHGQKTRVLPGPRMCMSVGWKMTGLCRPARGQPVPESCGGLEKQQADASVTTNGGR
jgi:hypothetical protein